MSDIVWLLSQLDYISVIDILTVALIFYTLFFLVRGTPAVQLLRGIFLVVFAFLILTSVFTRLTALSWLVRNSLPALLVSLPVIFQPELRRGLQRLGRTAGSMGRPLREESVMRVVEEVTQAALSLSESRYGALIVLEVTIGLQEYIDTGVPLDAVVSSELLTTTFFPNTPLHDGALVIRSDRVLAAACLLPLSEELLPEHYLGTRHRAAVGITEQSDAVVVVVSEETGIISVAHNGRMIRRLDEKRLRKVLQALYRPVPQPLFPHWLYPSWLARGGALDRRSLPMEPTGKRQ
jgi:diadenylate cyclase